MGQKRKNRAVELDTFITVAFAEDMDLAQQYQRLLEERQIPVKLRKVGPEQPEGNLRAVAVMVPEEMMEAAYQLISQQVQYDDFFYTAFMERTYQEMPQSDEDDE